MGFTSRTQHIFLEHVNLFSKIAYLEKQTKAVNKRESEKKKTVCYNSLSFDIYGRCYMFKYLAKSQRFSINNGRFINF